jgi:hypothetical protein
MEPDESNNFLDKLAKIITFVFHPWLLPLYGMLIIFSAPTLYGYLPFNVKKILFLVMLVNNILIPVSLLPLLYRRHIISDWSISERKERFIPLLITTILYGSTSYIIFKFPIPVFFKSYIFATALLALMVTIINFRWKISLHSVGSGALIALIMLLSLKMFTPLLSYLIPAIILTGFILASRLKLNQHNPLQVWLGLFAGFFGFAVLMMVV